MVIRNGEIFNYFYLKSTLKPVNENVCSNAIYLVNYTNHMKTLNALMNVT